MSGNLPTGGPSGIGPEIKNQESDKNWEGYKNQEGDTNQEGGENQGDKNHE